MTRKYIRKKRKLQDQDQSGPTKDLSAKHDFIASLPPELLSEILSYASTKEVLALARCNLYLFHTLVNNPGTKRIWVSARNRCIPPLPEPTPNFTESSYAAFIFDGGYCENCGKYVKDFYESFMLRLRVCKKGSCFLSWIEKKGYRIDRPLMASELAIVACIPVNENNFAVHDGNRDSYEIYRLLDYQCAHAEYCEIVEKRGDLNFYNAIHHKDEQIKSKMIEFCLLLRDWKEQRWMLWRENKESNTKWVLSVCSREAWDHSTVVHTPSFAALLSESNRLIKRIVDSDLRLIKEKVEAEMAAVIEKREHAQEGEGFKARRKEIWKLYDRLKTTNEILPTREVFAKLPVVASLQNRMGKSADEVATSLMEKAVLSLVHENLVAWVETSRNGFAALLGYPNYRKISDKSIHPTDRLTALFRCTRCTRKDMKGHKTFALDFRAACSHRCHPTGLQESSIPDWSVENFELDQKAISATRRYLKMLNVSEEDKISLESSTTSHQIMCLSCDGAIVMDYDTMKRHSHRHIDFPFAIYTTEQVAALAMPAVDKDLCRELHINSPSAKKKRKLKRFGCRHCIVYKTLPKPQWYPEGLEWDENRAAAGVVEDSKKEKWFSFDGIICHLKSRHGVSDSSANNEDIYLADLKSTAPLIDLWPE